MRLIALLAIAAALAACSKSGQEARKDEPAPGPQAGAVSTPAPESATAPETAAAESDMAPAGEERFYGKRAFTIVYKQTGTEAGDVTEHVRDWGRKRAEIKKTTVSIAGVSQNTATRTVYDGEKMATTDLNTGVATVMANPMYRDVVGRMEGKSGVEFGKEMMAAMGGKPTGESGSFAGAACDYWELAQFGTRMCIAPWGATLKVASQMGPVAMEKVAIEIREGDGGPDEAFAYDASKVRELPAAQAPNLDEIMKRAKGN